MSSIIIIIFLCLRSFVLKEENKQKQKQSKSTKISTWGPKINSKRPLQPNRSKGNRQILIFAGPNLDSD